MNWKSRLLYSQNWNIGFCEQTPDELISMRQLKNTHWMKHSYTDRWFADPFIYNVSDEEIVVFVEECTIENPKGILCELHVDRKSYNLRERYVLLELDTHLSYPAIIEHEGKIYVYPENGASGKLNIYEYDGNSHCLINPKCILNEAVADSTILEHNGFYYLIATKSQNSQEEAFLFRSNNLFGPYSVFSNDPVQIERSCSRPAGNWITIGNKYFRPSQDCSHRYGGGINIMEVHSTQPYAEREKFHIAPLNYKYNLGIHTLNFSKNKDWITVDGYGYLFPAFSRLWNFMSKVKQLILRKKL